MGLCTSPPPRCIFADARVFRSVDRLPVATESSPALVFRSADRLPLWAIELAMSRAFRARLCRRRTRAVSADHPLAGPGKPGAERQGALRAALVYRVWKGAAGGGACPLCARGAPGGAAAAGGRGGVGGRSVHVCKACEFTTCYVTCAWLAQPRAVQRSQRLHRNAARAISKSPRSRSLL